MTLCHEHLSVDLGLVRGDADSTFTDSPEMREEVLAAKKDGIRSIIEVSCDDMGRDVNALRAISKACGINIVCSCGFYLEKYHPDWVFHGKVDEIRDLFVRELTEGIDDTDIKAGVIGEVAGEEEQITRSERHVITAAGLAAAECGCAITSRKLV